ncbi:MAG TPA: hypothetical protein VLV17_00070 [Anaeromyxobacteraceae bacterium]|nr:hypothetical protein [Anaeromyxobacteraceae bacterium]
MTLAPILALALAAESAPFHSLEGGETLGTGGTVAAFSGGFSLFSAAYAQGLSEGRDWGLELDADWLTTELFAGGLYRQLVWRSGGFFASGRLRAGLYGDLGASYAASANRADGGLSVSPGLAGSVHALGGLFSLGADLPLYVTLSRGGGFAFGLKGSTAFEAPVGKDLALGARLGILGLWSFGGAPFAEDSPRASYEVGLVLTYQLL